MASDTVDLTEHREFSSSGITLNDFGFPIPVTYLGKRMLPEEVLKIKNHIDIFGLSEHIDESKNVFNILDRHMYKHMNSCVRCGKPFHIPWKHKFSDLCDECDKSISNEEIIPWKSHEQMTSESDILDLR